MTQDFVKDPDAVLDFAWDWKAATNGTGPTDWLASNETISTRAISATAGLTVDSSEIITNNTVVRVWLSGGTAGATYEVRCRIVTNASRTDDRTITIRVQER